MNNWQAGVLGGTLLGMLLICTALVMWPPFWLTQGHVIHMLEQYIGFLFWIAATGPLLIRIGLVIVALLLIYKLAMAVTGCFLYRVEEELRYNHS